MTISVEVFPTLDAHTHTHTYYILTIDLSVMSNRNRAANTAINNKIILRIHVAWIVLAQVPERKRVCVSVCVCLKEARGSPKTEMQVAFRFRHIIPSTERASINNVIKINYPLHSSLFPCPNWLANIAEHFILCVYVCFTALRFYIYNVSVWYLEFGKIVIVCWNFGIS